MEPLTAKIENSLRLISNHLDYFIFKLKNPKLKPIPKGINSVLMIDMKFIGDLIINTPLIRALKEKYPKAKIDILVPEPMKEVLSKNPNLNKILTKKEELNNYDLGVLLYPGNKEYSLLLKQKAKFRIGIRRPGFSEPKGYYLHRKPKPKPFQHKIEDNLDITRTINIDAKNKELEIYTTKESENNIKKFLKKNRIKKYFIIHPCPQHKTHEWSKEKFAELADKLIEKYKANIIFTGAEKGITYNKNVISLMKNKALNFQGNIKEFFSIIKQSSLVISVDTSAMHIAATFNKPVISLFGAGNPKVWHPYCKYHIEIYKNNVCTSCMKHRCFRKGKRYMECMNSIEVKDILNAVEKFKETNII